MQLQPGDEIILSVMEHHSNLVPWQMTAKKTGATLKFVQLTKVPSIKLFLFWFLLREIDNDMGIIVTVLQDMRLDLEHFYSLLTSRTRIVAISHASNVLGITNPVKEIISAAHSVGLTICFLFFLQRL